MKRGSLFLVIVTCMMAVSCQQEPCVSDYNVVWDSPSENAAGCMPIGNGEVGANLWVEPSGDIVFYLSRTDSWSEIGELYKLGRIRVSTEPSLTSAGDFRQTLDYGKGCINLKGAGMDLDFFIDSESPTVYLKGSAKVPVKASVKCEIWRDREKMGWNSRSISRCPNPDLMKIYPDKVLDDEEALLVYHHNCCTSYDSILNVQNIQIENREKYDPFLDRCFGFRVTGENVQKTSDTELATTATVKNLDIRIRTFSEILHEAAGREDAVRQLTADAPSSSLAKKRTAKFWKDFWNRSYIYVQTPDTLSGKRINESYIIQRWIQACGGRGNYAIKYNGSIFTVDPNLVEGKSVYGGGEIQASPDYRDWGGDFWWQNTRLSYYPMLKSGDYDMMKPLFEHYFRNLPMMKANAKALAGVDGALSPETATPFGTYCYSDFVSTEDFGDNLANNPYIRYHWDSSVEMISLMLDYYDYTQDKDFVSSRLVPYAREMLKFYKNFYGCDEQGKLLITPTQSLETYWYEIQNDMPTVAGLRDVLPRLTALPAELSGEEDKALWKHMTDIMPDLPIMTTADGKTEFAPAASYKDVRSNCENPRLYAIFPFHLCNVSTDNLQIGIDTYNDRVVRNSFGWSQDGQEAARLGLADEAARILSEHTDYNNASFRLQGFWGPNFDWVPDQDHGANLMITLQDMVLQTWDGKDYLLPAFPKEWGVKYKLHSFAGKTVEGEYNWK